MPFLIHLKKILEIIFQDQDKTLKKNRASLTET